MAKTSTQNQDLDKLLEERKGLDYKIGFQGKLFLLNQLRKKLTRIVKNYLKNINFLSFMKFKKFSDIS